jgi:hypothetical protein
MSAVKVMNGPKAAMTMLVETTSGRSESFTEPWSELCMQGVLGNNDAASLTLRQQTFAH